VDEVVNGVGVGIELDVEPEVKFVVAVPETSVEMAACCRAADVGDKKRLGAGTACGYVRVERHELRIADAFPPVLEGRRDIEPFEGLDEDDGGIVLDTGVTWILRRKPCVPFRHLIGSYGRNRFIWLIGGAVGGTRWELGVGAWAVGAAASERKEEQK